MGPGDAYAQAVQTLGNIQRPSRRPGPASGLVRTAHYVTDISRWGSRPRPRRGLREIRPATSMLEVSRLSTLRCGGIEAEAYVST